MQTTTELYATPIAKHVEALQDAGRNVWIIGFSADGKRALIAIGDRGYYGDPIADDTLSGIVSIAPVGTVNSLGRYENHLRGLAKHYYDAFPIR